MEKRKLVAEKVIDCKGGLFFVKAWQDENRIWLEVERVYETRWDCSIELEGVQLNKIA